MEEEGEEFREEAGKKQWDWGIELERHRLKCRRVLEGIENGSE